MLRDIMALVDTGDLDDQFIRDALAFARFHDAHLSFVILSAVPTPDYALILQPPFVMLEDFVKRAEDKQRRILDLAGQDRIEIRILSDDSLELVGKAPVQARYVDLVLVGPPAAYASDKLRNRVIEAILMASGRPVLVLPAGMTPRAINHIAVGWNATREATRALHDALVLLAPKGRIDIITVDPRSSDKGHGSQPGADIACHLARHGYVVEVHDLPAAGRPISELLTSHARRRDADLLVIGAYAHSRLRELILGGVTRDLMKDAVLPVLLAH